MRVCQLLLRASFLLLLFLVPFYAQAAKDEVLKLIPEDFKFKGKPISALCITEIANGNSDKPPSANLLNCTKSENKYIIEPYQDLINNGFTGFDYKLKNSTDEYIPTESAYYKYLGKFNNLHIIYLISSGGGSGSFSSIFLVGREGDKIEYIKEVVSVGDRCNGGIDKASFKENKLIYSINISPYDYIDLSGIKLAKIKPYDDLAACATCCQGTAQFESDLEKNHLVAIDLGETPENSQGTHQECFNTLLKNYKQHGKQVLSPQELKEFVTKFKEKCL